jgi:hypothetical protein
MPEQTIVFGLAPEEIVERETGSYYSTALLLAELIANVEAATEEFRHYPEPEAVELTRRLDDLRRYLDLLSLTDGCTLTFNRTCARCGGAGQTQGANPCIDCDGQGFIDEGPDAS